MFYFTAYGQSEKISSSLQENYVQLSPAVTESFVTIARDLLAEAMPAELVDDRFDQSWQKNSITSDSYKAVVASVTDSSHPDTTTAVGIGEGWFENDTLRLELLISLTVNQAERRQLLDDLYQHTAQLFNSEVQPQPTIELWARPTSTDHNHVAETHALTSHRQLFQMRLTSTPETQSLIDPLVVTTEPFKKADITELVAVNNRAFVDHPDQGTLTAKKFHELSQQSWFDPEGIRLHKIDGKMAAFCWTKVHTKTQMGELYVVAVDPSFQGQGLGKAIASAGIHWLQQQRIEKIMLYVEASNTPALGTYNKLSFTTVRVDQAWTSSPADTATT